MRTSLSGFTRPAPTLGVRTLFRELLPREDLAALEMVFELRLALQAIDGTIAKWLSDICLSPARLQILAILLASGTPVPQRDLVREMRVSRATVSELVEGLLTQGFVETEKDTTDRRQVLVKLSKEGERITGKILTTATSLLRVSLQDFSEQDFADLTTRLHRISEIGQDGQDLSPFLEITVKDALK